jgi:hypothetical protein
MPCGDKLRLSGENPPIAWSFRMPSVRYFGLTALVTTASSALPALASESITTRIEPRPFYGASVTVEEGVRVFRPLPPHKHVVINPENKTPVSLIFNETPGKSGVVAAGVPFAIVEKAKPEEKNGTPNPAAQPPHYRRQ